MPLSDNSQVILDALVVDVLVLLKVGDLNLATSGGLRKGTERCLDGSRLSMKKNRGRFESR